jgi:hypothetical protein
MSEQKKEISVQLQFFNTLKAVCKERVNKDYDILFKEGFGENEMEMEKFKNNIFILLQKHQDTIESCLKNPNLKRQMILSLVEIIQLGVYINHKFIYFSKFNSKTAGQETCSFKLQYQAERTILEKRGLARDVEVDFVLKLEEYEVIKTEEGTKIKHIPNFEKRQTLKNIKEMIQEEILFGYATYTNKNNKRTTFIVNPDSILKSINTSKTEAGMKWGLKTSIGICIYHRLYEALINNDEDFDIYEDEKNQKQTITNLNNILSKGNKTIKLENELENEELI